MKKVVKKRKKIINNVRIFILLSVVSLCALFVTVNIVNKQSFFSQAASTSTIATIEAEQMTLPNRTSSISNISASGGTAVKFASNGTASTSFSIPTSATGTSLAINASSKYCKSWPSLTVNVDGVTVMPTTSINSTTWKVFSNSASISEGTHKLTVTANNISKNKNCTNELYLDLVTISGQAVLAPVVTFSASPSTITPGQSSTLTWTATNATTCFANWTQSTATSGSQTINPTITTTYSISCSGEGGTTSQSTTLTVSTISNTCPNPAIGNCVPYDSASAWNTPIPSNATVDANSAVYMNAIINNGIPLTSDPTQYTIPVYIVNSNTPRVTVTGTGYYHSYLSGTDTTSIGHGSPWTITNVPVPTGATAGVGSDGQIVFWDPITKHEWQFFRFVNNNGVYTAQNGAEGYTGTGYYGRFGDGLAGRGAGTPYFAGLVRPWEIAQGHIDHALAFAYNSPSSAYVYPASKSDGGNFGGVLGVDLPEGARIQLDPTITDDVITSWGCTGACMVIAHALQKYGMYNIDHSGSTKIYLEYQGTANWDSSITRNLVSSIPLNKMRVISGTTGPK